MTVTQIKKGIVFKAELIFPVCFHTEGLEKAQTAAADVDSSNHVTFWPETFFFVVTTGTGGSFHKIAHPKRTIKAEVNVKSEAARKHIFQYPNFKETSFKNVSVIG